MLMADPQLFQPSVGLCSPLRFFRRSSSVGSFRTEGQHSLLPSASSPTASSTDSPRPVETKHSLEFILNDDLITASTVAPRNGASEVEVRIASVTASSTNARPSAPGPRTRSRTASSTRRVPSFSASSLSSSASSSFPAPSASAATSRRSSASRTSQASKAPTGTVVTDQEPKSLVSRTTRPKPTAASKATNSQATATTEKEKKEKKRPQTYEEKRLARKCTVEGCYKYTINRGLCFRHGGGKKCSVEDCTSSAKIAGRCWKHGGSIQCVIEGCDRRGKSRGLCWTHGGGTKCTASSCTKVAVSNGLCWAHGGGKRCVHDGCRRPAYERTFNYCTKHYAQFHNGDEVVEV